MLNIDIFFQFIIKTTSCKKKLKIGLRINFE